MRDCIGGLDVAAEGGMALGTVCLTVAARASANFHRSRESGAPPVGAARSGLVCLSVCEGDMEVGLLQCGHTGHLTISEGCVGEPHGAARTHPAHGGLPGGFLRLRAGAKDSASEIILPFGTKAGGSCLKPKSTQRLYLPQVQCIVTELSHSWYATSA